MARKSSMAIIFIVILVDMIGFGIIVPFLTYMVESLSQPGQQIGRWVAGLMAAYAAAILYGLIVLRISFHYLS